MPAMSPDAKPLPTTSNHKPVVYARGMGPAPDKTYDGMALTRVEGKRREVRQILTESSKELLSADRSGAVIDPEACPLRHHLPLPTSFSTHVVASGEFPLVLAAPGPARLHDRQNSGLERLRQRRPNSHDQGQLGV